MEIITTPITNSGYSQTLYGMTASEAKTILPLIKRGYNRALKMIEHYQEYLDSGEATDRQTTALMKWQDKADTLAHILNYIDDSGKVPCITATYHNGYDGFGTRPYILENGE